MLNSGSKNFGALARVVVCAKEVAVFLIVAPECANVAHATALFSLVTKSPISSLQ